MRTLATVPSVICWREGVSTGQLRVYYQPKCDATSGRLDRDSGEPGLILGAERSRLVVEADHRDHELGQCQTDKQLRLAARTGKLGGRSEADRQSVARVNDLPVPIGGQGELAAEQIDGPHQLLRVGGQPPPPQSKSLLKSKGLHRLRQERG